MSVSTLVRVLSVSVRVVGVVALVAVVGAVAVYDTPFFVFACLLATPTLFL